MKYSVCADILEFSSLDCYKKSFSERLYKIKADGFDTFEFWSWKNKNIDEISETATSLGMNVKAFSLDSKNDEISKMLAVHALNSGKTDMLKSAVYETAEIADKLKCKSLIITIGDNLPTLSYEKQLENIYASLSVCENILKSGGITLLVEPINRFERKEYLMPDANDAIKIIKNINSDYIKVLYDCYHQAREGKTDIKGLISSLDYIGHIHMAGVPQRKEPDLIMKETVKALKESDYKEYIGLEYIPTKENLKVITL